VETTGAIAWRRRSAHHGAYKFKGQQSLHFEVMPAIQKKIPAPPSSCTAAPACPRRKSTHQRRRRQLDPSARASRKRIPAAAKLGVTKVNSTPTAASSGPGSTANSSATKPAEFDSARPAKSTWRNTPSSYAHKKRQARLRRFKSQRAASLADPREATSSAPITSGNRPAAPRAGHRAVVQPRRSPVHHRRRKLPRLTRTQHSLPLCPDQEDRPPPIHRTLPGTSARCGRTVADLKQSFLDHLCCGSAVPSVATPQRQLLALALTVRRPRFQQGVRTLEPTANRCARWGLPVGGVPAGPHLAETIFSIWYCRADAAGVAELGLTSTSDRTGGGTGLGTAARPVGLVLPRLAGRRSRCPPSATASGYEFGIFDQASRMAGRGGHDNMAALRHPWEIARPRMLRRETRRPHRVLDGRAGPLRRSRDSADGRQGVAYDTPILGYRVGT